MKQKVPVVLVVLIHFITSRIIQPMPAYYYYAFSEDTLVPDLRTGIIVSIVLIIVDYFAGTFLLKRIHLKNPYAVHTADFVLGALYIAFLGYFYIWHWTRGDKFSSFEIVLLVWWILMEALLVFERLKLIGKNK